jgi:hypothetical protein
VRVADEIALPHVILSDFDHAFKRAARIVFDGVPAEELDTSPPDPTHARARLSKVKHQICLWHVMKNVCHNVKKKWIGTLDGTRLGDSGGGKGSGIADADNAPGVGPEPPQAPDDDEKAPEDIDCHILPAALLRDEDRRHYFGGASRDVKAQPIEPGIPSPGRRFINNADGLLLAWQAVVYADTEESYHEALATLFAEFSSQTLVLEYLRKTYLPVAHQFCTWAVKSHRNYGIRSTSRTEGSHFMIKNFLRSGMCDFEELHKGILLQQDRLLANYKQKLEEQTSKVIPECQKTPLLEFLCTHVGFVAMRRLLDQCRLALDKLQLAVADPVACTGNFTRQFGLPCWHMLYWKLQTNANAWLEVTDVDRHWWLREPGVSSVFFFFLYTFPILILNFQHRTSLPPRQRAPVVNPTHESSPLVRATTTHARARRRWQPYYQRVRARKRHTTLLPRAERRHA